MNHKKYKYSASDTYLDYEFDSDGPKGKIRKIVRYSPQNSNGVTYFNLGFGDLNLKTGKIDDMVTTNNHDRERVLATVAATVIEFTKLGFRPIGVKSTLYCLFMGMSKIRVGNLFIKT